MRTRMQHALALVALASMLAFAGCQSSLGSRDEGGATPAAAPLRDVIESGVLRVALSGDQPPFNMRGHDGELMGLDVDLARALAGAMGLEAELVPMPFAELMSAVEARKVDVVISALTITPERNARVPFAGPYYVSGTAALSRSDELAHVTGLDTLDVEGSRLAAVSGTTNERFVRENLPKVDLVSTKDFDEAVGLVLAGDVDAVLADYPLCKYAAMRHPDAGFSDRMTPFTVEPLGIAIRADAPLLVNLVQNYLDTLEYAGLLGQLKARWLGDDDWLEEMP